MLDSQEFSLRADLNFKRASVKLAQTSLEYTRILAPDNGIVSERKVHAGQLVSPGTQVLSLVQSEIWVQANFKETQVRNLRSGDPAEIRVDAFPGMILKGRGRSGLTCQRIAIRIVYRRTMPPAITPRSYKGCR
ncbi:MAG: efflux RND transporter periplasmic adaptor subunit [Ignavibacteriota bacterium]